MTNTAWVSIKKLPPVCFLHVGNLEQSICNFGITGVMPWLCLHVGLFHTYICVYLFLVCYYFAS